MNRENDMGEICSLVAFVRARPEKAEEFNELLSALVAPARAEPGCIDYHCHRSVEDPSLFIFYENWRSREELDAHLARPYLQEFFAKQPDYTVGDPEVTFCRMASPYR